MPGNPGLDYRDAGLREASGDEYLQLFEPALDPRSPFDGAPPEMIRPDPLFPKRGDDLPVKEHGGIWKAQKKDAVLVWDGEPKNPPEAIYQSDGYNGTLSKVRQRVQEAALNQREIPLFEARENTLSGAHIGVNLLRVSRYDPSKTQLGGKCGIIFNFIYTPGPNARFTLASNRIVFHGLKNGKKTPKNEDPNCLSHRPTRARGISAAGLEHAKTRVEHGRGWAAEPEVNAGGFGGKLGNVHREQNYEQEYWMDIESYRFRNTVSWTLTENTKVKSGIISQFPCFALLGTDDPFVMHVTVGGSLSGLRKALGTWPADEQFVIDPSSRAKGKGKLYSDSDEETQHGNDKDETKLSEATFRTLEEDMDFLSAQSKAWYQEING